MQAIQGLQRFSFYSTVKNPVRACKKAIEEGLCECPDMPHSETIRIMEQMDAVREKWGLHYPMEK